PHRLDRGVLVNVLNLPWLELAFLVSLVGGTFVARLRQPEQVYRWGVTFIGASFACTALAWLAFHARGPDSAIARRGVQPALLGRHLFALDELGAPLIPAVALLHFLTALATARTSLRRFSFSWSMTAETVQLATFSCKDPWVLIVLLSALVVPPY